MQKIDCELVRMKMLSEMKKKDKDLALEVIDLFENDSRMSVILDSFILSLTQVINNGKPKTDKK